LVRSYEFIVRRLRTELFFDKLICRCVG